MNSFFYTASSGWLACLLIAVGIALPYLLRRTPLTKKLGLAQNSSLPYLRRMWPHYWVGYLCLALSFYHAWIPMASGRIPRSSLTGLWLATFALFLLFVQLLLGLALKQPSSSRALLRKVHFWSMVGVSALVLAHIVLNS